MSRSLLLRVVLGILLATALACNLLSVTEGDDDPAEPDDSSDSDDESDDDVSREDSDQDDEPQEDPASDDQEESSDETAADPGFVYEGISLTFTPDIASAAAGEKIEAVLEETITGKRPAMRRIEFSGGVKSNSALPATLIVFSPAEYIDVNYISESDIDLLKDLISGMANAGAANRMPYLPYVNAGQMFFSNVELLPFGNGHGIRFVSQYAQAITPVNNEYLIYAFQGLTADGDWYVSVTIPLSHVDLPPDWKIPSEDYQAFEENFETYLSATKAMLNKSLPESFTPTLTSIDQMISTIVVK